MPQIGRFSTGIESMSDAPANRREGTFADGLCTEVVVTTRGRFSTGIQSMPDAPAKRRVGSFADTNAVRPPPAAPTPRPATSPETERPVASGGPVPTP
jgi:hypothetical protein